jgi:invasion protein IalB
MKKLQPQSQLIQNGKWTIFCEYVTGKEKVCTFSSEKFTTKHNADIQITLPMSEKQNISAGSEGI